VVPTEDNDGFPNSEKKACLVRFRISVHIQ